MAMATLSLRLLGKDIKLRLHISVCPSLPLSLLLSLPPLLFAIYNSQTETETDNFKHIMLVWYVTVCVYVIWQLPSPHPGLSSHLSERHVSQI